MGNKKVLLGLFVFFLLFGVILQVLVQTSLAPPMHDANFVGGHLNRYDIQLNRAKESNRQHMKSGTVPVKLKKVVAESDPITENSDKVKEFVDSANAPVDFLKTVSELEVAYGKGADLDNSQARDLYLEVVKDAKVGFNSWLASHMTDREVNLKKADGKPEGKRTVGLPNLETMDEELEHAAVLCSISRSRIRRYVRDRMADRVGAWSLFARDAWKYGAKDLAGAIATDAAQGLKGFFGMSTAEGKTTPHAAVGIMDASNQKKMAPISKSGAALASMGACMTADDSHPCPAFSYLKHVRERDAKAILNSCFRSNEFYNEYFATEKGMAAVEGKN